MKNLHLSTVLSGLILALGVAALPAAHAQQKQQKSGSIEVKNVAEVEIETKDAKGKIVRQRAPVAKAIPGTEVIYTTTFKNIGAKAAGNIVINNPVPANTTLVAGSVFGETPTLTRSTARPSPPRTSSR